MASTVLCDGLSRSLHVSSETRKNKDMCSKCSSLSRGSSQAATRIGFILRADCRRRLYALQPPAMKMFTSNVSNRGKYTVGQGHHGHWMTPTRHLCGPVSRYLIVFSSINMSIFGYWVGPDIEDGWGYIEAAVDQVFDF